tara:strand:- start:940 stop:1080 length:141 start_codon:yes stop_codon:yes gene_type:complete
MGSPSRTDKISASMETFKDKKMISNRSGLKEQISSIALKRTSINFF